MWKFLVKNQSIEILEREVLADHQIRYVQFKFTFDGDWKKFHKVVQFSQCDEVYSIVLGTNGTSCYLPAELHVGAVKMSVFGYDAESDTTVRATTVPVTLNIRPSGFVGDDDTPIPPTPDLYTQLLQKIAEIQAGVDGKDGLSAYEIAKENGFAGTVSEWLESLKGIDGLPGKDGIDGKNGTDGKDGKNGIDGKDGITPDMSEYPKTTEVATIIQQEIAPVVEDSHTHDNKSVLDSTTASYTAEEQQKLAEITPNDYATKEALHEEVLSIREAMIPLTRELHSHQNMATLDTITPDMLSELGGLQQFEDRTVYEIQTLNEGVDNLSHSTHTHDNKAVLDSTTASYTTEEQQKLASINPSDYATKADYPDAAAVNLMIQKITYPLSLKSHEHENKATLDALTPELLADLQGLQQFEDSTIYEMQTFRESVEPVVSQAHWHHNLTLLNSITAAKIAKWDSFENFGTQINGLSTRITVYSDKVDSSVARIGTAELNIENLQKQIDALKIGRNYTRLFHYGQDAMSVYAPEIGIVLNGGYHLMNEFSELYPNFCSAANDHAISYSQEDFNWDAQVLTVCTKELSLTENSEIVFSYQSGAAEEGHLYLVKKPQYCDVPVTIYVKDQIEAGRAVSLNFKWLQSDSFISTVTECGDITAGTYYLAWVGRSNNTHPLICSVKVLEG